MLRKKSLILLSVFFCFFSEMSFASDVNLSETVVKSGFNYKNSFYKETEPDNNFNQALRKIIPMPCIENIYGKINTNKDIDYYLVYITRPVKIRLIYTGNSGFLPVVVIYNEYKQYMGTKTYSSAIKGNFNSSVIEFNILKTGFYFFKIGNLFNVSGYFYYKFETVPLDLSLYPGIKEMKIKQINNLSQDYLQEIFYRDIIKKFKNFEKYKNFRN